MKKRKFSRYLAAIIGIVLAVHLTGCASAIKEWDPTGAKRARGTVIVLCLALQYRKVRAATKGKILDSKTMAGLSAGSESCAATLSSATPSVRQFVVGAVCAFSPPAVIPARPDPRFKDKPGIENYIPKSEKKRVKRERNLNTLVSFVIAPWCMMRQE